MLKTKFQTDYFRHHVRRLPKAWGMYHHKPEPQDHRQDDDADPKLKDLLGAVADGLELWGFSSEQVAFGFADESSPMANSNTTRLWSFFSRPRLVNSDKDLRHNTFGFYAIQGKSVAVEIESSRAESFEGCLGAIKKANPQASYTAVIWDNMPAHCHCEIEKLARSRQIFLVSLPPYSPELNQIEKVWKQVKRQISCRGFIDSKEKLSQIIISSFKKLTLTTDLTHKWIEEFFIPVFGKILNPLCTNL